MSRLNAVTAQQLDQIQKQYDGSETDTIRQHEYNAELLMKKVIETNNEEERTKLRSAAATFKNLAMGEWCNR